MRAKIVKTKLNLNFFLFDSWGRGEVGGGDDFNLAHLVENTKKYLVEL